MTGAIRQALASRAGRDAVLLLGAQGLLSGSGFVFWAVVARAYPMSTVGLAGSLIATSALVAQVSVLGMNQSILRFAPGRPDPSRLTGTALTLVAGTSVVVGALTVAMLDWADAGADIPLALAAMFVLGSVTTALVTVTDSAMLSHHFTGRNLAGYAVSSVLRIALPILFVPLGATGILAANVLAQSAVLAVALVRLSRRGLTTIRPLIDTVEARALARFAGTSYVAGIAWVLPLMALPAMAFALLGADASAQVYIVLTLISFIAMLPMATTQSLFASAAQPGSDWQGLSRRTLWLTLALTAGAGVAVIALGWPVLGIFGPAYQQAYPLLVAFVPVMLLVVVNLTGNVVLKVTNQLPALVWINVGGAAVAVIAWWALMPTLGAVAVPVGYAASQGAMALGHAAAWHRLPRIRRSPLTGATS